MNPYRRWWREMAGISAVHHCVGGVYVMRDVLVADKGVPEAVVATIERGRPFIDVDIVRRGGNKAREEARSGGRKSGNAWWRANADHTWRLRSADETSRLPFSCH
jgi:hypothetical protein